MSSYITRNTPGDTAWFRHDRFGMFIHWGLYAMPARHEWIKTLELMSEDHYQRYFERFDPDMYDPRDWARRAKAAGMKYAVFTAKHHEGFCMFDSRYTDYKCVNTPAGRDLLREYVDAFRAEGLKVGFYYSLIDWHHPHFTIDVHHPRRFDPDAQKLNEGRDMRIYAQYMRDQVTELLTNYGRIDILWFDFSYPDARGEGAHSWLGGKGKDDWESEKLIALARSLMPGIIIDNRADMEQDLWTPEQFQPTEWVRHEKTGELCTWEACQTFSGSWGYHRDEQTWKSPEMLIRMLVNNVSLGGNLLMNVGPTARGYLDDRACDALQVFADWMKYHSRAIYGCTMAEPDILPACPQDCRFTQTEDGRRLYLHLFAYPFAYLLLPGLADKVEYAQFLHDGSEIICKKGREQEFMHGASAADDTLILQLPHVKPRVTVPVIELFLKEPSQEPFPPVMAAGETTVSQEPAQPDTYYAKWPFDPDEVAWSDEVHFDSRSWYMLAPGASLQAAAMYLQTKERYPSSVMLRINRESEADKEGLALCKELGINVFLPTSPGSRIYYDYTRERKMRDVQEEGWGSADDAATIWYRSQQPV